MRSEKAILLIEDDEVDVMTVKRALRDIRLSNPLETASNGEEALHVLEEFRAAERPCMILLDIHMPRMNGIEFLRRVKEDSDFQSIPVVVLTTSTEQRDRLESFRLGAAGYMLKPMEYEQMVRLMRVVDSYWSESELPD